MELITYDQFKEACNALRDAKDLNMNDWLTCAIFICFASKGIDPRTIPDEVDIEKQNDDTIMKYLFDDIIRPCK